MPRTALILGAGSGGIVAANELRRKLPATDRVVIVDREAEHLFAPSLLWVMIGDRSPTAIARPLDQVRRKGIEVVRGNVESIDPSAKSAVVEGVRLTGDALIVALGAELDEEAIPGLASVGHDFYTLKGATAIRDALARFQGGRIVVLTAAPAYKCPAAPYEAAMLVEYHCRRLGVRDRTSIEIRAAEPAPMVTAGPEISAAVRGMVESKGIAYRPSSQVVSASPGKLRFQSGEEVGFDLLLYVPPHRAPKAVRDSGLLGESGWVSVDRESLATKFPGVYAVGDVTSIPLKIGRPLPKAGVFAHAQAVAVAQNVAREWTGAGRAALFDGVGKCFVETGDHRAGIGSGNFYADPAPRVRMRKPRVAWHLGKVLFEKTWLRRWF